MFHYYHISFWEIIKIALGNSCILKKIKMSTETLSLLLFNCKSFFHTILVSCNFYIYCAVCFFLIFYPISLIHPGRFIRLYSMWYSEKPKIPENIFRMETFTNWQIFPILGLMKNGFQTHKKCIWNILVQDFLLDFRTQICDLKAISFF